MYWATRTPSAEALQAFGEAFMEEMGREGGVKAAFNKAKAAASLIAVQDRASSGKNVTLEFGDPDGIGEQPWR